MGLDRLTSSTIQGQSPVNYTYAPNGNLLTKGNTSLDYHDGGVSYRVASAKVKGATTPNRTYAYDAAGHVTGDGKRDYTWTSFGQLATLTQTSAPALDRFAATGSYAPEIPGIAGIQLHLPSQAQATFAFDAAGSRSQQVLVRDFADTSAARVITRYLGSFEIEEHATKPVSGTGFSTTRILHRHRLGSALLTVGPDDLGGPTLTRLAVILTDHIGSTDVIVRADLDPATGTWKTASAQPQAERQSFDAWGDRRNAANWSELRTTDAANRQTSAMDYDRGFTGHEMLDDFGLIHMNGRIYDPEIGRFLSPDPYVQVPEYSQNFNRYTYVLNNPLSYTDSSGHMIDWIAAAVVAIYKAVGAYGAFVGSAYAAGASAAGVVGGVIAATGAAVVGLAVPGVFLGGAVGGVRGALLAGANVAMAAYNLGSSIAAGGDAGDVLRGIGVNFVTAILTAGLTGSGAFDNYFVRAAGHGILQGSANAAMGGKFQDGFIGAAAGSLLPSFQPFPGQVGGLINRAIVGGTAAALGGGKFANGAASAAFSYLFESMAQSVSEENQNDIQGRWFHPDNDPGKSRGVDGHGILGTESDDFYQKWANRTRRSVFHIYSEGELSGATQDVLEVATERLLFGAGSRLSEQFVSGFEQLPAAARKSIDTHSQGVSPVIGAMFRRPDLFKETHLNARSSSVYQFKIEMATKWSRSEYTWDMPPGDIANLYSSLNPLKVFRAILNPIEAADIHSRNATIK